MRDEQVRDWLRRLTRAELVALQEVIDDEIQRKREAPRPRGATVPTAPGRIHLLVRK